MDSCRKTMNVSLACGVDVCAAPAARSGGVSSLSLPASDGEVIIDWLFGLGKAFSCSCDSAWAPSPIRYVLQ